MSIFDDLESVAEDIVDAAGDVAGGVVDVAASMFEGPQGLVGIVTAGVGLFVAGPAALIPAFIAGSGVGQLLIRHRPLHLDERAFAEEVFGKSLPANDRIILTNLSGLEGRAFVCPNAVGEFLVNIGNAFDNPMGHVEPAYPHPGKLLIHELTHVWQLHHATFVPGLVCEGIFAQLSGAEYAPGPGGKPWSDYNLEQQATIVDEWFAPSGRGPKEFNAFSGMRPDNPFYPYIRDNIGGPRWQKLDENPATVRIAAEGDALYQLHNSGLIFRYTGTPMTGWEQLDKNPATVSIVASGGNLYQLHNSGLIFRYTGTPMTGWEPLDNNPATISITADGNALYQLHNSGLIFRYTGTPMTGWEQLDNNPATKQIAAAGGLLYQRHEAGVIWKFTGTPMVGWKIIDNNPATVDITAAGDKLYQLHQTGLIWRYPY